MQNLISFVNAFLEYFIVFAIAVALMLAGSFIGITMRKKKNAKDAAMEEAETATAEN